MLFTTKRGIFAKRYDFVSFEYFLVDDATLAKLDEGTFWDKQLLFEISNEGENKYRHIGFTCFAHLLIPFLAQNVSFAELLQGVKQGVVFLFSLFGGNGMTERHLLLLSFSEWPEACHWMPNNKCF